MSKAFEISANGVPSSDLVIDDLSPVQIPSPLPGPREEGYWTAWDGTQLFWQTLQLPTSARQQRKGGVLLMHGYGEHCGRYAHVMSAFVRGGYDVLAFDARGHGRSTGKRGFVRHYDHYVRDLALARRKAEELWGDQSPLFVLGHSNGGLITLRYALTQPRGIRGFVLSSPMCRLAVDVPPWKALAGQLMSRLWPTLALPSEIEPADVSRDPQVVDAYARDPLVFDVATARWFTEQAQAQDDLFQRASSLNQPFLFVVAGDDKLVDAKATEQIYHRLGASDRELEIYPELYHEVLNESRWQEIFKRILGWMDARLSSTTSA